MSTRSDASVFYSVHMMSKYVGISLLVLYTFHMCCAVSVEHINRDNTTYQESYNAVIPANHKQIRWANAAFNYVTNLTCSDAFFTTEKECEKIVRLKKSEVNIYLADPTAYGRLAAVVPDGGLSRSGLHDAVVVVDPYPLANFGHLVIVFYIDLGFTDSICQVEGGKYIGNGECMRLALKRRCKNALESRRKRRNFFRRCEINFLPLVYLESSSEDKRTQLLSCRDNIPGFAPCAALRPNDETSQMFCDPIVENTRRCETSQDIVKTRCRVFEICDQAVLLSGGWDKHGSLQRHKQNILNFYHMLRKNGFKRDNIKVFFANGLEKGIQVPDEEAHVVYPAAMKLAMRFHIKKMCENPHCVDSLVFYMNSPSRNDGTSLLWDINQDGRAEESERYSMEELLDDFSECAAHQVHVIVDQSYAGEVARAFRRSHSHRNVIVYASGRDGEYSWGSEYTDHWVNYKHTQKCTKQVHEDSRISVRHSSPELFQPDGLSRATIFGAPCDVTPPFTPKELRRNYWGCQNLPTALWLIKLPMISSSKNSAYSGVTPLSQRLKSENT